MIPHPSTGNQPTPRPRAVASQSAPTHTLAQPEQIAIVAKPRQVVIDLTDDDRASTGNPHPAKRVKLDTDAKGTLKAADLQGPSTGSSLMALSSSSLSRSSRERPAWTFPEQITETITGSPASAGEAHTPTAAALPPFPVRPWKYGSSGISRHPLAGANVTATELHVQTTPYHLEAPSVAPKFGNKKAADFSPWTGNHPEDVLSDQTAKQGYYDRVQVSQNETNTARPSLYAQFKHRSGLEVLSSVFAATIEKREAHSKVMATSTFKPPPRVTLTDIKREAWLRDLANVAVPLRRLSRTIPHGIRGKVLLDQCLSKNVPISRAVWLAKCVGANEIRAFKRKGTSGALAAGLETKWVRDWTTNVQQFVESVITTCGETGWKAKMAYAVRLAARLLFEHLLDQDHYLDWFLTSLEAASLDKVPAWFLMIGVYWDRLVRYRKRGRRFAECLLAKLKLALSIPETEIFRPLSNHLAPLVKRFIYQHPSSFILPQSWPLYESTVAACLDMTTPSDRAIFDSLADRNRRISKIKGDTRKSQRSAQQQLVNLLDSSVSRHDFASLSVRCLVLIEDRGLLVSRVLEWASTHFRHGQARTYLAVRLLRKWTRMGVDVGSCILSFLLNRGGREGLRMDTVYHIISELIRSQSFSVGRYLQWLMARGVVSGPRDSNEPTSCDIELLHQVPTWRLPDHVHNLRNILLQRAGYSLDDEFRITSHVKASLKKRLPSMFPEMPVGDDIMMGEDINLSSLSWTCKSDIGQWIRQEVAMHYKDSNRSLGQDTGSLSEVSALTAEEFFVIRDLLERLGDLSMLADILKDASNANDVTVLASAADTLNYHFESFCVIGAAAHLFKDLTEAYTRVKNLAPPVQDFVSSLVELGVRLPNEAGAVNMLRQDLARLDRKIAMAASSPVSDHMADTLHPTSPMFSESIEQLLSSGNSMDEPTMARVFDILSKRLEANDVSGEMCANDTGQYLSQLRTFNPKHFDLLMIRWMETYLKTHARPGLCKFLPSIIGVGCVTLPAFSTLVKRMLKSEPAHAIIPDPTRLRVEMLQLLGGSALDDHIPLDLVSYRFRISQQDYLVTNSRDILDLLREAINGICPNKDLATMSAENQDLFHTSILPVLMEIIVRHPHITVDTCTKSAAERFPSSIMAIQQALNVLLDSKPQDGPDRVLAEAEEAVQLTNDFSLPFCQLKLQILFDVQAADTTDGIFEVMFKAAESDVRAGVRNWVDLVSVMNPAVAQQVRQRAEKEFFAVALLSGPTNPESGESRTHSSCEQAGFMYLSIIEELAYKVPDAGISNAGSALFEKMNGLLQRVIIADANYRGVLENSGGRLPESTARLLQNRDASLLFWFSALLRLTVIHRSVFIDNPNAAKSISQEAARLLIPICCIALSPILASRNRTSPARSLENASALPGRGLTRLQTYALDVAASLADSFSDEVRYSCARFLQSRCPANFQIQNNPHLLYLLGPFMDTASLAVSATGNVSSLNVTSPTAVGGGTSGQMASSPATGALSSTLDDTDCLANRLRLQQPGRTIAPYFLRPWEMLEEAAPIVGINDTAVGLEYFGAKSFRR